MPVTRVEPSTKLFDPARTFRYTNAANTDLAKRFKAMQVKAKAEARAKGQTELDARQQLLELPMPEGHTGVVVPMAKKGRAA